MSSRTGLIGYFSCLLVWSDDSGDGAGSGRGRPLYTCRVQHVQIFQAGARVEKHHGVVRAEEATIQQLLVGDKRCGAFGRGENAFQKLLDSCFFSPDDTVVLFNTGSGLKYLDVLDTKDVARASSPASRPIAGIIGPY